MSIEITRENIGALIKSAIDNKEIKVFYQPKHNAVNGKVAGAEALARWITSDGEMISPGRFIPLLEELGLISDLDWYMLEETCRFLSEEIKNGRRVVTVSVNFSRLHTSEPDFAKRLSDTVD